MKKALLIALISLFICPIFARGIGYALSGGGARGFAHVGILKVLEEEGIKPDFIAGTSLGALIGAYYALGYNAAEVESIVVNTDWSVLTKDRHDRESLYIGQKRWAPYGNLVFEIEDGLKPLLPSSVLKVNNVNLSLFQYLAFASQEQDFDNYPIPFRCVATDIETGEARQFSEGSLVQAIRASISVPSLLMPFKIGDHTYIDGGISQNMPIKCVMDMGADFIVGSKVNSSLKSQYELQNIVDILDQTINIGMTRNLSQDLENCDLLLEPNLQNISSSEFKNISEIIKIGEDYARENIEMIRSAFNGYLQDHKQSHSQKLPPINHFKISKINVIDNNHISPSKIREYLGLQTDTEYNTNQILKACIGLWDSQYFHVVYPDLTPDGEGGYQLSIYVQERKMKQVAINNSYNEQDKLMASFILMIDNELLKNSKLMLQLGLGGRNELNIDYVKNFGELWGVYYRIFSYVNEKLLYAYDNDFHQTDSFKSLEYGGTTGVGLFTKHHAILELFLYHANTGIYHNTSGTYLPPRHFMHSGFGIKGYHESLDDLVFPKSGLRMIGKMNFARQTSLSDYIYSNVRGKIDAYYPVNSALSTHVGLSFGSYLDSVNKDKFDPYAIGGMDGFKGYSRYAVSSPHYYTSTLSISANPYSNLFVDLGVQGLKKGSSNLFEGDIYDEYCLFAGIGMRSDYFPVRAYIALNENRKFNTMFSLGYDFDIFEFSRK